LPQLERLVFDGVDGFEALEDWGAVRRDVLADLEIYRELREMLRETTTLAELRVGFLTIGQIVELRGLERAFDLVVLDMGGACEKWRISFPECRARGPSEVLTLHKGVGPELAQFLALNPELRDVRVNATCGADATLTIFGPELPESIEVIVGKHAKDLARALGRLTRGRVALRFHHAVLDRDIAKFFKAVPASFAADALEITYDLGREPVDETEAHLGCVQVAKLLARVTRVGALAIKGQVSIADVLELCQRLNGGLRMLRIDATQPVPELAEQEPDAIDLMVRALELARGAAEREAGLEALEWPVLRAWRWHEPVATAAGLLHRALAAKRAG
jgi:hypothetical protein